MVEPDVISGRNILVVEDDFFVAEDIVLGLSDAGAVVLGPVGTIEDALGLIAQGPQIDAAVLDVNLHGEWVYPVAEALEQRAIPYIFTTGYDAAAIDRRYAAVTRCEKPVKIAQIAQALFA